MFSDTPSTHRGGGVFSRGRDNNSLGEPLLGESSSRLLEADERPSPRWLLWSLLPLAVVQLAFGAGEKVIFARMASVTPHGCLLIHTHLAALNAILYALLQVARSQSPAWQVPYRLRRVQPARVLVMGLLDATHSLFVIDAAEKLRGTTQVTLLQATLPLAVVALALTTCFARRGRPGRRSCWPSLQTVSAVVAFCAIGATMLPGAQPLGAAAADAQPYAEPAAGVRASPPPALASGGAVHSHGAEWGDREWRDVAWAGGWDGPKEVRGSLSCL